MLRNMLLKKAGQSKWCDWVNKCFPNVRLLVKMVLKCVHDTCWVFKCVFRI